MAILRAMLLLAVLATVGCCAPQAKRWVPVSLENLNARLCYSRPRCAWWFPFSCPRCPYYPVKNKYRYAGREIGGACRHCSAHQSTHCSDLPIVGDENFDQPAN